MSEIILMTDGQTVDLYEIDGVYRYLGDELCRHGSSSKILSVLHRLAETAESLQSQLAEALKPKVCRWTKTVNEWYPYTTGCEGVRRALLTNYCSNCGGKVEVE